MAKRDKGIVFSFEHDGSIKFAAPSLGLSHVFHPRNASLECNHFAALKGWKSTIEDAGAKSRDTDTGQSAPLAERFEACKAIAMHYANKNVITWGRKATGGSRGDDVGLVLQALMNVKGWDVDKANHKVAAMAEAKGIERGVYLAALAKNPDIIREVADIKAKRAAASNVDSVSMLNELADEDDEDEDEEDGVDNEDNEDGNE